jgi:hypothetical protein
MIESQEIENQGIRLSSPVRTSTLSLVDLVGSECLEPQRMDRSLATLDEIITIMSQAPHNQRLTSIAADFPFGNSKLTRLLQPSLSGKAQVAIICTIIPSMECLDETHNTLKFASRAHRLRHHASINKTVSNVAALKKYRETIHHLENQLEELELRRCQIIAAHNEGNIYGGVQAKLNLSTIMEREVELKHTIMRFNRAILHSSQRDLKLVPPHNNQENSTEEHDKDETASQTPDNEIFKRTSSSQTICINHDVRSSYDEAVNQVKPEPQEYQTKFSYSDLPSHSKVTSILKGRSMKLLAQL